MIQLHTIFSMFSNKSEGDLREKVVRSKVNKLFYLNVKWIIYGSRIWYFFLCYDFFFTFVKDGFKFYTFFLLMVKIIQLDFLNNNKKSF